MRPARSEYCRRGAATPYRRSPPASSQLGPSDAQHTYRIEHDRGEVPLLLRLRLTFTDHASYFAGDAIRPRQVLK